MTTAEITRPVHRHIAGGTWVTLAFAPTRNGWGIHLAEWTTYRGETRFEVNRETPKGQLFRLGHFATEAEARAFANREYLAEMGLAPRRPYIAEATR